MEPDRAQARRKAALLVVSLFALALVLSLLAILQLRQQVREHHHLRGPGDGVHLESYGFDLSGLTIPKKQIVSTGQPRDFLTPIDHPVLMRAEEIPVKLPTYRRFLGDSDRVIGLVSGHDARAYPLRVLNWHEIVLDELGGIPVAITYNPLCDSAVVMDRRSHGQTLELGVSGLLANSNLLFYDRSAQPSLWSQLRAAAISGPRRGETLAILPCQVMTWKAWHQRYPQTRVLTGDPQMRQEYKRDPFGGYLIGPELRFPAEGFSMSPGQAAKTPLIALKLPEGWKTFSFTELKAAADAQGDGRVSVGGEQLKYHCADASLVASFWFDEARYPTVYALSFAWQAAR